MNTFTFLYVLLGFLAMGIVAAEQNSTLAAIRLSDATIRDAVDAWLTDPSAGSAVYGHISEWDTSNVTDMSYLFYEASSFDENISGWDTSNVTTMRAMFVGATSFDQDLSGWNTSSVTTMRSVFFEASSFNGNISGWDTSNVTIMRTMFFGAASFGQDLSGWNTTAVTDVAGMFAGATAVELPDWYFDKFTKADGNIRVAVNMWLANATAASTVYGDISEWDTSDVTDIAFLFATATDFNEDLSGWDTANVIDMSGMFFRSSTFNGDVSGWDTFSVIDMSFMFYGASNFNGDVSGWDTSSVIDMSAMFYDASSFNGDVSGWDTSNVTNMYAMFYDASSFNGDVSGWDTSSVISMYAMFQRAERFNQDISHWDTSSVTTMQFMFHSAAKFNQDISQWNTTGLAEVSGREEMFRCASSFHQSLCWNDLTTEWKGLENIFCGSKGRFDPSCATEDQIAVSGCFSVDEGLCLSEEEGTEWTDEQQTTWYIFTIPVSSNYVAAGLNVLLEFSIILAVGEMFLRLESRRLSNLLRNGAEVQIRESEIPLFGEGLLVRRGLAWRAMLRFLVMIAIWVAEFSASGRTETLTVIHEALVVGGDVTIFDVLGEENRTSDYSWPFTFNTTNASRPTSTHFSANYTDGPNGVLKQAEASCSNYYPSEVGLRQVALRGIFVEDQLRSSDFECLGDELVRVTDNAVIGGVCSGIQFLDFESGGGFVTPSHMHWYGEGEATRGGIARNITVFTVKSSYFGCVGSLSGIHDTILGIDHQPLGGGIESGWLITRVDRTYYVTTFLGPINAPPGQFAEIEGQLTRQIVVESKLDIAHLLVKAMIDTGVGLAPNYLDAVSEAWYTNRGSANGLTNVILRESGPQIELLGETGTLLNSTDRMEASFTTESTRAVTDVDVRFLFPLFFVILVYIASRRYPKGEFPINRLNYVSRQYHKEFTSSTVDEEMTPFAVVALAGDKEMVRHVVDIPASNRIGRHPMNDTDLDEEDMGRGGDALDDDVSC